jgi:hypothetical protein
MGITDIIKESLTFPTKDTKGWMIIGVLFLVMAVVDYLIGVYPTGIIYTLCGIISLILSIFILGYGLSLIKNTIDGKDNIPAFDFSKNFVDGLKSLVLYIVYFIIPTILTAIVMWITGVFSNGFQIIDYVISSPALNQTLTAGAPVTDAVIQNITGSIPTTLINSFFNGFVISIVVGIVLFLIFTLFTYIGLARMAEYDSLKAGLSLGEVFKKISSIGWGSYIGWFILLIVVSAIIGFIGGLVSMIPYLGVFIFALVFTSFLFIFEYRAIGLIYNQG